MQAEEAHEETLKMLKIYEECTRNVAAMPVIPGRKSRIETFAGANATYTIEAMMGDKKALQVRFLSRVSVTMVVEIAIKRLRFLFASWAMQAGTSHNLGTNFAKVFGTQYLNQKQQKVYVHQTSWGVSTRLVGGVIMTHGDDAGLRLPPMLAPVQVCSGK